MTQTVFNKSYHGFESLVDLEQDIVEAFQESDFLPEEFDGVLTVDLSYTPKPIPDPAQLDLFAQDANVED